MSLRTRVSKEYGSYKMPFIPRWLSFYTYNNTFLARHIPFKLEINVGEKAYGFSYRKDWRTSEQRERDTEQRIQMAANKKY